MGRWALRERQFEAWRAAATNDARADFLASLAAVDRQELSAFIQSYETATGNEGSDFLEVPVLDSMLAADCVEADAEELARVLDGSELRIVRPISSGSTAHVYEAVERSTGRRVAVKVLLLADGAVCFENEVSCLQRIKHPGVPRLLRAETWGSLAVCTVEFVRGCSLDTLLPGALQLSTATGHALRILQILQGVHSVGLIHADLKPSNVVVDHTGAAHLIDFGIACSIGSPVGARLSVDGEAVAGSPGYMSPEQIRGDPMSTASDVWSLACTLYELVTGQPLFLRETVYGSLDATLNESFDPESVRIVSPALSELLVSCLQPTPEDRASFGEVAERLQTIHNAATRVGHSSGGESAARKRELQRLSELVESSQVVNVWGLPGVGKSHLARLLFGGLEADTPHRSLTVSHSKGTVLPPMDDLVELDVVVVECPEDAVVKPSVAGILRVHPRAKVVVISRHEQEDVPTRMRLDGLDLELDRECLEAWSDCRTVCDLEAADFEAVVEAVDGNPLALRRTAQSLSTGCAESSPVVVARREYRRILGPVLAKLDVAEQRLVRQFAVFRGGWTAVAGATVTQTGLSSFVTMTESLVRQGILSCMDGVSSERFDISDGLRQLFLSDLPVDQLGRLQVRHLHYFGQLAQDSYGAKPASDIDRRRSHFQLEYQNLEAALLYCASGAAPVEDTVNLVRSAVFALSTRPDSAANYHVFSLLARRLDGVLDDTDLAELNRFAGIRAHELSKYDEAEWHLSRALSLTQGANTHLSWVCRVHRVINLRGRNCPAEALSEGEAALGGDPPLRVRAALCSNLGMAHLDLCQPTLARPRFRAAARAAIELKQPQLLAWNSINLAATFQAEGDVDRARAYCGVGLSLAEKHGFEHAIAGGLEGLGRADMSQENYHSARRHLSRSLAIWQRVGNTIHECNVSILLGRATFEIDRDSARRILASGLHLAVEFSLLSSIEIALDLVAEIAGDLSIVEGLRSQAMFLREVEQGQARALDSHDVNRLADAVVLARRALESEVCARPPLDSLARALGCSPGN